MATAASLLASNQLKWKQSSNPLLRPPRLIPSPLFKPSKFSGTLISHCSPKLTVKCLFFSNKKLLASSNSNREREISADPFEIVVETVIKALNALKKPVIAAILLGLLLMFDPESAWAASGGRMGGRSFASGSSRSRSSSSSSSSRSTFSSSKSSSSSASSSSPSRSYSSSSSPSSYASSSSPSRSYSSPSSPSRSYSSASSPSRGYSSSSSPSRGYSSSSSPSSSSSSSSPSRSYLSSSRRYSVTQREKPSFSSSVLYDATDNGSSEEPAMPDEGVIQKQLTQLEPESEPQHSVAIPTQNIDGYHASRCGADSNSYGALVAALLLTVFVSVLVISYNNFRGTAIEKTSIISDDSFRGTAIEKTSILKLQVGLLGMGHALQRDLNQIAEVADTSNSNGLSYILTETTLALLRNPDYCFSGLSSADVKWSVDEGEKCFNKLSIEERAKFDEETLVNVDNIKRRSTNEKASESKNEYIVVTILVAAEGEYELPVINGIGDLKEALKRLGCIQASKLMAVEVLWTPQKENDTLSERELHEDYPLLKAF